ncbi:MAG TPA: M36 family metallopeptidase [Capillimicrobium sp.]|nr:M36 family metallopeptidase [Capillimicrobium sp.]
MHARSRTTRRTLLGPGAVITAALALALATAPSAAFAAAPARFFDVRDGVQAAAPAAAPQRVAPGRAVREARAKLERSLGPQGIVDEDPITGTARAVQRLDGALTGPASGSRRDRAWSYVQEHATALGLDQGDLGTLVADGERRSDSGLLTLRWRQEVDGIPAFDNGLTVNVDGDGRVITVFGSPRGDLPEHVGEPVLSAPDAVRAAMDDVSVRGEVRVVEADAGPRRHTRFAGDHEARLVLFGDVGAVRLAWRVLLHAGPGAVYDTVVDAADGRILRRANLVKGADTAIVYRGWPGNALGSQVVDLASPPSWLYTPAQRAALGLTDPSEDTTFGPRVWAWADLDDDNDYVASELADRAGDGSFEWPLVSFNGSNGDGNCAAGFVCTWDDDVAHSWQTNQNAAIVNSFYLANAFHDHLEAAPIGFDADDGNFEGDDPIFLNAMDGAATAGTGPDDDHIDNANMLTYPDGDVSLMQMYLASTRGGYLQRDVSYDFDPATVWHEYTHGLSNRLIVDADGWGALSSPQAAAMGEGWSDFYALDLMAEDTSIVDTAADGEVSLGAYPDPVPNMTRHQAIDCAVGSVHANCPGGGYTYGDFGDIAGQPEVHADGEIWAQTLWDLRAAIGVSDARLLVTEGMRLTPPEPSFLDARNGILAALEVTGKTALRDEVWDVFRNRGMGFYAGATSGADVEPVADTSPPPPDGAPTGTATGLVKDADTGSPVAGAEVGLGGHDGTAGFSDVTGADGRYTLQTPGGTYPSLYVQAPGYDAPASAPTSVTVSAGSQTAVPDIAVRRNWSTLTGGATLAEPPGGSCGRAGALDGSPGTGWSAPRPGGAFDVPPGADPPTMTITLPRAVDITAFGIDPSEACGDDASAALGEILVETSNGGAWTPALSRTFGTGDRGGVTEYAPTGGASGVVKLRVTLVESQDPSGASGEDWIDLTELKVYGTSTPAPSGGGGGGGGGGGSGGASDPGATTTPTSPTTSTTPTVTPVRPSLPPSEPPATVELEPALRMPRTGTDGEVTVRVTCADDCTTRARLLARGRLARRLGERQLAAATDRPAAGEPARLTVSLTRGQRRELRQLDRDDRVRLTLAVTVTQAGGAVTRERRTVLVAV